MSAAEFAAGGTAEAAARAAAEFAELAADYLDDLARRHPDTATSLGDHRFDDRLPDESGQAQAAERRALEAFTARLAAIEVAALSAELRVDAGMLADGMARRVFEIDELRENTWNPLQANPGQAIYLLLARDFAPLPDRLAAVAGRLAQVPEALAAARRQSGQDSRWAATAAASASGSLPTAKAARSAGLGWLACGAFIGTSPWPLGGPACREGEGYSRKGAGRPNLSVKHPFSRGAPRIPGASA